jgi:hypothetical protein
MRYLVASKGALSHLRGGCRILADGDMTSFEQPRSFGAPLIGRLVIIARSGELPPQFLATAKAYLRRSG